MRYMLHLRLQVASIVGGGWNDFSALSVGWFDGLAAILVLVEESGNWPIHMFDAHTVTIRREGGDAVPIGQIPQNCLT